MIARSFVEKPDSGNTQAMSLRELNRRVAALLSVPQLQNVWVTAELSDVRESGGHCYLELIDKNESTGIIDARLRGIIWVSYFYKISATFAAYTGQRLSTGLRVMVRGSINYHPAYGMSFVINDINPSFTLGDVERRRKEILMRLDAEGILDLNRSLDWNTPALRIAIVSAKGAAGYGDFMNQLYSNSSSLKFVTRLFPAVLQGERAARSVIEALDEINASIDEWDCVVIIRGGGATSDLVSFDNYELAANVAQFPLPVIVGIGHERDVTVLDYVANVRVKTPTAAAEMLIARAEELLAHLRDTASDMLMAIKAKISGCNTQLAYLEAQLPVAPVTAIERKRLRLDAATASLHALTAGRIAPQLAQLDQMPRAFRLAIDNLLARRRDKLASYTSLVEVLSPMATLKRGYTITRIGGKAVTSAHAVTPGDKIVTIFSDGKTESIITE
ncbi:MAG: exodeoxyribonuclease VII large subunit [Paramuribaculum sp.]|nr:exodeoxyribonuclease VII large subunit [Paramuribaculum sp.]